MIELLLIAQLSTAKIADWTTTGLVGINMAMEIKENHNNWQCIALRNGIGIAIAETTKHFVHKERPDKSDNKSFYSEHSELAMINSNWKFGVHISFAVGAGRMIAKKHDIIDVSVGLGAGYLINKVCK